MNPSSDFEARLARSLNRAAGDHVESEPNWHDVQTRVRNNHNRRLVGIGAAATAVVVASAGAVALAANPSNDDNTLVASSGTTTPPRKTTTTLVVDTTVPATTPPETVPVTTPVPVTVPTPPPTVPFVWNYQTGPFEPVQADSGPLRPMLNNCTPVATSDTTQDESDNGNFHNWEVFVDPTRLMDGPMFMFSVDVLPGTPGDGMVGGHAKPAETRVAGFDADWQGGYIDGPVSGVAWELPDGRVLRVTGLRTTNEEAMTLAEWITTGRGTPPTGVVSKGKPSAVLGQGSLCQDAQGRMVSVAVVRGNTAARMVGAMGYVNGAGDSWSFPFDGVHPGSYLTFPYGHRVHREEVGGALVVIRMPADANYTAADVYEAPVDTWETMKDAYPAPFI